MKKILSIILAAAMLMALCPAVFAADTTKEFTGYNYVFNSSVYGSTSDISRTELANYTFDDIASGKSAPWKLASLYRVESTLRTDYFKLEAVDKVNEKACFAIELEVEQGGTYLPKLAYTRFRQTGIVDIYLAKKGTSVTYDGSSYTTDKLDSSLDSYAHENTYNFLKGINDGADGQYVLKTGLDMYEGAGTDTVEEFGKRELTLEGNTSYYLIVNIKGANQAFSGVSYPYAFLNSFSLTPMPEDPIPEDEFNAVENETTITSYNIGTVTAVAYTVGDTKDDSINVTATPNTDGTYTLNAPEYTGYNFLYWKKGVTTKKDVITYKPTGFVYAPTAGETNYLIAVYEKDGESTTAKAEFYNANGQFIEATNGSFPTDIPSMAGYGDATGWKCYTNGETYELTGSVTPNGIMLFVADYKDTPDTVKVNGKDVLYGTEMSFTASPEDGKTFKCWTRTDDDGNTEIVSIEKDYKFCAYENCIITEVDSDGTVVLPANTRKIILDTFRTGTATVLMAEFIGFKNDTVVEKGIMFGNNRIAMKSTGTQFTIIPDETGTYEGYAIIKNTDNNGYTLITDGEYGK